MTIVAWVILAVLLLAVLFLGAARASSGSMSSDVRPEASNGRPVAVAQAEVAARAQHLYVVVDVRPEAKVSETLSEPTKSL